mmetsp:Transcript_33745/g.84110  ORF Transcript_33745/g.84110 Transcript_33745/m.84110 type:complete len:271 (-) Transcript_33745:1111-1923(-)
MRRAQWLGRRVDEGGGRRLGLSRVLHQPGVGRREATSAIRGGACRRAGPVLRTRPGDPRGWRELLAAAPRPTAWFVRVGRQAACERGGGGGARHEAAGHACAPRGVPGDRVVASHPRPPPRGARRVARLLAARPDQPAVARVARVGAAAPRVCQRGDPRRALLRAGGAPAADPARRARRDPRARRRVAQAQPQLRGGRRARRAARPLARGSHLLRPAHSRRGALSSSRLTLRLLRPWFPYRLLRLLARRSSRPFVRAAPLPASLQPLPPA